MDIQHLLQPGRIGPVEIANRIVMPPMTTRTADAQGFITDASLAYYRARARGGVGLITVEMAAPEPAGRHRHREVGISSDAYLPGLRRLVDVIHGEGAKASIQLGHGGGHTRVDICGETPVAPSAIAHPVYETTLETIVPLALTEERITRIIEAYAAAARRAEQAGFDCVEIHAAHGYLISQFHAPLENHRTDAYGGSLANRARFGLEVLRAVKAAVPRLGVIYRLSVEDFFPGGMPWHEGLQVALWAAAAEADALHISCGHYRSLPSAQVCLPPMSYPEATFIEFAAGVRRAVSVPVIAVGRLGDPVIAAAAIAQGKADFVAIGRSLLADPAWVNKVRRGERVRRCLACNTCINEMRGGAGIGCLVNATTGHELEYADAKPPAGERIAVIGAGPAGLTYASLVAEGNEVVVFDRAAEPGGAFRHAGKAPLFQAVDANEDSLRRYVATLVLACQDKGVVLRMAADVTSVPGLLATFDRIVIATGARYRFGLGPIILSLLELGAARWPGLRQLMSWDAARQWFYYRLRAATGDQYRRLANGQQTLVVIGDAVQAGKSQEAIASAFRAALLGDR